ncbi:hypothetical protein B0H13DRAFT_1898582 [Mycena leptocephala]|nr:hypothetical protein B0H13DRAFT_1898582 [Mycena leptocephala]
MDTLAPELIEEILDQLDIPDAQDHSDRQRKGLKSCALLSRKFRHLSQARLFRTLVVRCRTSEWLTQSPHVASYVRDLIVGIGGSPGEYEVLTYVFCVLTGVQRIIVTASESWYMNSPPSFRNALRSLLSLLSLQCVAFSCAGIPASLLLHALSSYKTVALNLPIVHSGKSYESLIDAGMEWKSHSRTPQLNRLRLKYSPAVHDLMISADVHDQLALQNLRCLTIDVVERWCFLGLENLVVHCPVLHHLLLDFSYNGTRADQNAPPFALPPMPTLRLLSLRTVMTDKEEFKFLMCLLPSLPTCAPVLEVFTFYLDSNQHSRPQMTFQPEADEALTTLVNLREAHFIVSSQKREEEFVRSVQKQLPLSSAAGLVRFSRRNDHDRPGGEWFSHYFSDPYSTLRAGVSEM